MEKIWLQSYPAGVPAEIDIEHIPSLVALFEQACSTYADKVAYIRFASVYRSFDTPDDFREAVLEVKKPRRK